MLQLLDICLPKIASSYHWDILYIKVSLSGEKIAVDFVESNLSIALIKRYWFEIFLVKETECKLLTILVHVNGLFHFRSVLANLVAGH